MKPLSSFTYIKSNPRKVLPSFICTIISVFLIYLFGLLLYGSVNDFNKLSINLVNKGTILYTNNPNKPVSDKIAQTIKDDSNVKDVVPFLGEKNNFNFNAVFGNVGTNAYVFYSEDVGKVLRDLNIELVSGTIPKNNSHEILLPLELAKQYKLKIGDYISNDSNSYINVDKAYKLTGITKGNVWAPIICDVGSISRENAVKAGMMYFFKDSQNMKLNDSIAAMKDKSIVIQDYKSASEQMDQIVSSMSFLYISLDIIILFVLCISLGNLNYIVFLNRRNEFAVLISIGFSKSKLRRKLFKENAIVCFAGYAAGIAATLLTTELLNIAMWQPKGEYIPIFRLDSMLIAMIIPAVVSLFSMLTSLREFNKLSYESLS